MPQIKITQTRRPNIHFNLQSPKRKGFSYLIHAIATIWPIQCITKMCLKIIESVGMVIKGMIDMTKGILSRIFSLFSRKKNSSNPQIDLSIKIDEVKKNSLNKSNRIPDPVVPNNSGITALQKEQKDLPRVENDGIKEDHKPDTTIYSDVSDITCDNLDSVYVPIAIPRGISSQNIEQINFSMLPLPVDIPAAKINPEDNFSGNSTPPPSKVLTPGSMNKLNKRRQSIRTTPDSPYTQSPLGKRQVSRKLPTPIHFLNKEDFPKPIMEKKLLEEIQNGKVLRKQGEPKPKPLQNELNLFPDLHKFPGIDTPPPQANSIPPEGTSWTPSPK